MVIPGYGPSGNVMLAIANGHYELAAFLLDRGADPNDSSQGWTALHQLARARAEPGKNRLNNGWIIGPNLTGDISGLDLARKLITKGANVNFQATEEFEDYYRRQSTSRVGATPLLMASRVSDYRLMKILLDAGADPNLATIDGVTPVMAAAGVAIRTAGEGQCRRGLTDGAQAPIGHGPRRYPCDRLEGLDAAARGGVQGGARQHPTAGRRGCGFGGEGIRRLGC